MKVRNFLQLSVLFVLTACSAGGGVGDSCETDAECGENKCLRDKRTMSGSSTCVDQPGSGTCSPACNTHADCQKYGATMKCALAQTDIPCNPTGICRDDYKITCTPGPCREAPAN